MQHHPLARLAISIAIATLARSLPAQQVVTVGVEGIATGLDAFNNPSVTRIKVGAAPTLSVTFLAGASATAVAQRLATDLLAQGVGAAAVGALLQISSGPNGTPLRTGVDFATNDIGHSGIVAMLEGAGPADATKTTGLTLPFAGGGQAMVDGNTAIDVDVEVPGAGGPVLQRYSLAVPFYATWSDSAINAWIGTQLVAAGLVVQSHSHMHSVLLPGDANHLDFQLDRDAAGHPVRRIAYRPGLPLDMRWLEVHPGREPAFGAVDYGQPTNHGLGQPLLAHMAGSPGVTSAAVLQVDTFAPNQLVIVAIGWAKASLPLPFVSPDARLLVDPTDALLEMHLADTAGSYTLTAWPPNDPALAGFRVYWQAADMPPLGNFAQLRLSPGLLTVLWP